MQGHYRVPASLSRSIAIMQISVCAQQHLSLDLPLTPHLGPKMHRMEPTQIGPAAYTTSLVLSAFLFVLEGCAVLK
jgi:hypothetical protein